MEKASRRKALSLCRKHYVGFGPTLAAEKLAEEHGLPMSVETLRGLLLAEGLWERKRKRDKHRQRRERRACFGEMVQADASVHDWLEGRGPMLTLVGMIDDATDRIVCRFVESETTEAYMDVLGRWIRKHGRPASWYSDRHGIFRAGEKVAGYDEKRSVPTQFSRALKELGIELILAGSPQAKGRVERLWGTAQDRLVKELRLAKAGTIERANDYTIRFENRVYQLPPPAWPGLRGGKVIVERRADGSMKIRFKGRYLEHRAVKDKKKGDGEVLGAPPPSPRSLAPKPIPAPGGPARKQEGRGDESTRPAVHRPAGRSGRTPAEPCPSGGGSCGSGKEAWRPSPNHPWR